MYISALRLKNWKNFQNAEAKLGRRVFLIGPNASGKSNLLDAFRFLRDVALDGLANAVENRGGVSAVRSLYARTQPDIQIEADIDVGHGLVWTYSLSFKQDTSKTPVIRHEGVSKGGMSILNRPDTSDEGDAARLTQTALEQISANSAFREIAEFFRSISYQHIVPQAVRDPAGFSPAPIRNDPFGRDFLPRIWQTNAKTRAARLSRIAKALEIAVPNLADLNAEMDLKSGVPHLVGKFKHWRPHGARQSESQFSDGTLRLIGLFWSVYEGDGPLILEEPEISLHPEIIRHLPAVLARINRSRTSGPRQIIVSTHSDHLLDSEAIGAEEVIRLEPGPEGTRLCAPTAEEADAMHHGLTAADILMPKAAPKDIQQMHLPFAT